MKEDGGWETGTRRGNGEDRDRGEEREGGFPSVGVTQPLTSYFVARIRFRVNLF